MNRYSTPSEHPAFVRAFVSAGSRIRAKAAANRGVPGLRDCEAIIGRAMWRLAPEVNVFQQWVADFFKCMEVA